jgi:glutaminyl-peptide cyclotransferase
VRQNRETRVTRSLGLLSIAVAAAAVWCPADAASPAPEPAKCYGYRIVHEYPHDPQAFTQGLAMAAGVLYESTGLYGHSELRRVDLATGAVLQRRALPPQRFGEGLTAWHGELIQLTWRSGEGFVYDRTTFRLLRTFHYPTEGWGLASDGHRLIMTDGSSTFRILDPESLKPMGEIPVRDGSTAVTRLNELEYVKGEVYANVWGTDRIARISPDSGKVAGWIDLQGLLSPEERRRADVLNGIAYDPVSDRLFVTGKRWPKLFEIVQAPSACRPPGGPPKGP